MTYEIYRYIFIGGLIACGLFFVLAVILFFTLRIPEVVNHLTGRTQRKAIERIRTQNEQSGDKSYRSSAVNLERGKVTDKISKSGRLIPKDPTPFGTGAITQKISTAELVAGAETDVLTVSEETSVLSAPASETTVLGNASAGETAVLGNASAGETAVLAPSGQTMETTSQVFTVEFEITYIHTSEVIG